jgi:hypothetical protein
VKITSRNAQELEVHQWYVDASLGNGQPFEFQRFDGNQTAVYKQSFGCLVLKVWND